MVGRAVSGNANMGTVTIDGFCDLKFQAAADAIQRNFDTGADVGASFCVAIEGEVVVDLWGGYADAARTRPWTKDTIVNVYSTTKTMMALTALMLADRGLIDFDAPVAKYWPEFAAAGKGAIKVSHLMSHSAGLSGWKEPLTIEDLYGWDRACALLAAQMPFWMPGSAAGYHGITQGHLVGEVVRRVTGKSLGTIFREEIAQPLDADFHIGLPASEDSRVAEIIPQTEPSPDDQLISELTLNMFMNPGRGSYDVNSRAWRAAEIPAANGHGNARSIAQIHSILANAGSVKGQRFMSEASCRAALKPQTRGLDIVTGMDFQFGLGFGLPSSVLETKNPNTIFWGGHGGSLAVIDMDACTTFGYAMNRMVHGGTVGDVRSRDPIAAIWAAQ